MLYRSNSLSEYIYIYNCIDQTLSVYIYITLSNQLSPSLYILINLIDITPAF